MSLNQTSIRAFSEVHLGRLMDAAAPAPKALSTKLRQKSSSVPIQRILYAPK